MHNSLIDVTKIAIGCNVENIIHLFKNADRFNLMELPDRNVTSQNSGDREYTDAGENVAFIKRE